MNLEFLSEGYRRVVFASKDMLMIINGKVADRLGEAAVCLEEIDTAQKQALMSLNPV